MPLRILTQSRKSFSIHHTFCTTSKKSSRERRLSQKLPSTPTRTRFAPSPTGYLHLGSLRTALFNFLLARATGGQFVLRIEDTDQKRSIEGAEERLYRDLKWSGLQWDEGPDVGGRYGPYKQSERTSLYQDHAGILVRSGHAYRCFCSSEKLNELARRRNKLGLPSDYDRTCEGLSQEESDDRASRGDSFAVRLRVLSEPLEYIDLVYGFVGQRRQQTVKVQNLGEALYDDPILLKSDGSPTYHLANVVDDHHMRITHVIRAAEWMSSTPKHLILYKAFGWQAPDFAHVGLLQNADRQKFSKRKGDLDISSFEKKGIFPEALLNYVALYGWSHTKTNDFMTLSDLITNFDLKFTKGNTIVQPHKLMYLQKRFAEKYVQEAGADFETMVAKIVEQMEREFEDRSTYPNALTGQALKTRIVHTLQLTAKQYTTPEEFFNNYQYLFYNGSLSAATPINDHEILHILPNIIPFVNESMANIPPNEWTSTPLAERLSRMINAIANNPAFRPASAEKWDKGIINKAVQLYIRWAIARGHSGPAMHAIMSLIGRDICLERLDEGAKALKGLVDGYE